ncbi:MAG: type IX secretion system outer membrane channel protein PorV [Chitinophagaceae bacterium]|nr:type IX secretion system outer membrane channel protein PorV [Chitinophagaceae bacterium]MBK8493761.1 type IX secretion system outer membrane channel protein PorV [Chitinophagaceae bacterium]
MKKVTLKLTALVMLLGGTITVSYAQNKINVVTSAVPFLRISPDARSGGMGDVGIATAPDANAAFANIARTPFSTSKAGVAINYTPWLRDLSVNDVFLASLAGYYKIDDVQAISASLRYFKLGSIQFTDALGNDLQQYNPREMAVDIGYSRKLSSKLGLGIAIRYINSNLASGNFGGQNYKAGSSVAGDLHLYYHGAKENGQGLNWGLTLSNLGSKISYSSDATQKDYIPANIGLGIAYTKVFDEANKITFALDLNKLLVPTPPVLTGADPSADSAALVKYRDRSVASSWIRSFGDGQGINNEIQEINIAIGAEYWYNNQFGFRAGYFYENPNKGNRKYFTVGAGIKYSVAALNFSYVFPTGSGISRIPLSNTYRFGLVFEMPGK